MPPFVDQAAGVGRRLFKPIVLTATVVGLLVGAARPEPASAAAGPAAFDGVYVGDLSYGTPNNPRFRCTTKFSDVRMRISNGTVSMNWSGQLTGTISSDGAVLMEATNGVKVTGTVSGNVFNGSGHGIYCTIPMSFTKQ